MNVTSALLRNAARRGTALKMRNATRHFAIQVVRPSGAAASKPSKADIFFKTQDDPEFDASRSYPLEVKAGRHDYYVPMSYRTMLGEVGLRLSARPSQFLLRAVEIRAVDF